MFTVSPSTLQRVWVLRTAYLFFHELQAQYQRLGVHSSVDSLSEKASMASVASSSSKSSEVCVWSVCVVCVGGGVCSGVLSSTLILCFDCFFQWFQARD